MTNKTYFIIDDTTTAAATCDFLPLRSIDEHEALQEAARIYDSLTAHDQRKRDNFAVCYGALNEDGIPEGDYDECADLRDLDSEEITILAHYDAAVELMDDELCEAVHMALAPCYEIEFLRAYRKAHKEKFGEEFLI